jgi:uncharacterized protein YhbP (UPF0306 family)
VQFHESIPDTLMTKNTSDDPDNRSLKRMAQSLIREQSTMTLATAHEDDAWAAAVYYVYHESVFYFFSDPLSRHIKEALRSGGAASAIHAQADTWRAIRGIQMSGEIQEVTGPVRSLSAIRAYLKKFPFTREFFPVGVEPNMVEFSKRFKVRLYCFRPRLVYYLDNGIRFGFRETITL